VARHEPNVADDETPQHRHERPEDWGWHGEFGIWARVGGVVSAAILVLMTFTVRFTAIELVWLYGIAAILVLMLVRDWYRRKNAWRE
jgi:hypothetical protein